MKKVCIDLTNIVPGKGGTGGGIATYGKELVLGIDELLGSRADLREEFSVTVLLNTNTYRNLELKYLTCHYFEVNNQNLLSRMIWLQMRLPRFLKFQKMDMLHRILSEMPIWKVCKYAVTVHDLMFEFYLSRPKYSKYLSLKNRIKFKILDGLLSKAIQTSDMVITNSHSTTNDLKERFWKIESKLSSVPLGYSQSSFLKLEQMVEKSDQVIRFGVIAAFHPHKGHLQVVGMAQRMVELGYENDFHFYFRGSPVYQKYYDEIKNSISERDLDCYFTFEEYDPGVTLATIYNRYSATILLSDYEGFGLPVIESQAYSRPVICSTIPVFHEILGSSAIFVDKVPTDEQINKLMSDLKDTDFRASLVERGKLNASQYTWNSTCRNTMNSYSETLGLPLMFS